MSRNPAISLSSAATSPTPSPTQRERRPRNRASSSSSGKSKRTDRGRLPRTPTPTISRPASFRGAQNWQDSGRRQHGQPLTHHRRRGIFLPHERDSLEV